MFKCELCQREFENPTKLVSHLTHPKSLCKTNIKDYYNQFLRKPNEGICIYCGRETSFGSLVKGYMFNKCKHCRNEGSEAKLKRKETYQKKRKPKKLPEGYNDYSAVCELCKLDNNNIRFKTTQGLAKHISQKHNDVGVQNYYDRFLKKPGEGVCLVSGKPTRFKNMVEGYFKYTGKGNNSADPNIQKKKEETLFKNYGVTNACKANETQRIQNFKLNFKKQRELKEYRLNLISLLRQLTIDKNDKTQCQICGIKFNNITKLSNHISVHNKITAKEYYNLFLKKNGEGICIISGLPTTFNTIGYGYYKYHHSAVTLSDEIKKGSKLSQLKYIKYLISKNQKKLEVEFLELNTLNLIGDLTKVKCIKCSTIFETRYTYLLNQYKRCYKCYPAGVSNLELELREYINSITTNVEFSNRTIIPSKYSNRNLELDIYIPSKNIAIEFDGLYWHSELYQPDKNYHLYKTNECEKRGIQLIHIFEDEWLYKKDIVKSLLKHKLGKSNKKIYARKCIIKEITKKEKKLFLNNYHIQGNDSSVIKLGAFYDNELVSVMTFSHGNISKGGDPSNKLDWELNRFATKYHVVGIAGKLLKHFQRNYEWNKIYSYADRRVSDGNLYTQLGFKLVSKSFPNYWYVHQDRRIHRYNLRKRPDEPKDIPEWQLRLDEGYIRIWDCGHLKFEITNTI